MKPFRAFTIPTAAIVLIGLAAQMQAAPAPYPPGYVYRHGSWYDGYPETIDRVSDILNTIDNPSERSRLAKEWLKFSRESISRSLDQRQEFLNIQARQLRNQEQIERSDTNVAQLQLQIEELRAQNLRLERENLEMRHQMQAGRQNTDEQVARSQ